MPLSRFRVSYKIGVGPDSYEVTRTVETDGPNSGNIEDIRQALRSRWGQPITKIEVLEPTEKV
jgi:hypothetical protein